jgi:uncharacterized membrane protein
MKLSTSGRISIASNIVMLAVIGLAWHGAIRTAPLPYAWHKFLHVAGVVMFMGNLIAGPLWLWFAWFEDEGRHFPFAARMLAAADVYLTTPGVQLTGWNGLFLAVTFGGVRANPWLVQALVLLVISSLFSILFVLPPQERLVEAAQEGDRQLAWKLLVRWSVVGMVVMLPFTLIAWLMVAKAAL